MHTQGKEEPEFTPSKTTALSGICKLKALVTPALNGDIARHEKETAELEGLMLHERLRSAARRASNLRLNTVSDFSEPSALSSINKREQKIAICKQAIQITFNSFDEAEKSALMEHLRRTKTSVPHGKRRDNALAQDQAQD